MDELKNFVSAQFLQSHWKILPAELLSLIHSGLPVYRQTGILIHASELLPEKTLLDITKELVLRAAKDHEARKCRNFITLADIPSSFHPRDVQGSIIIKTPPTPAPANTETLGDIDAEAKSLFEKLKKRKDEQTLTDLNTFLFNRKEINQYAQLHELKLITEVPEEDGTTTQPPMSGESCVPENKDAENFIRSLQVSYVNPNEISIAVGDQKATTYKCKDMGFKSSENGWKLLMEILNGRDHLFDVGTYSKDRIPEKIKNYNRRQKWIPQFTKKFINFLNREYGAQISGKTQLFENQKKKNRDGLYKPIFHVASSDAIHSTDIKKMSKPAVLKKINKLVTDRNRQKDEEVRHRLLSDIGRYAQYAAKNKWITEEQLRRMISLPDEEVSPDDALLYVGKFTTTTNDF